MRQTSHNQIHRLEHFVEIIDAVLSTVEHARVTCWRVVATTVHDARGAIDEVMIIRSHAIIDKRLELVGVVPPARAVRLHRVEPVEKACHPLEITRAGGFADCSRVLAEIDLRIERLYTPISRAPTHVEVELTEVADSRCLDDASSPPTAALEISAAFGLAEQRRLRTRACTIAATWTLVFPAARLDTGVVLATSSRIDIFEVLVKIDILAERRLIPPATRCWAPRGLEVPTWRFGDLRFGCAEKLRGRPIPSRLRLSTHYHVVVDFTSHASFSVCRRCGRVFVGIASIVLVGLVKLPTCRGGGVHSKEVLALGHCVCDDRLIAPIVLVARVVFDRLFHALCEERRDVDKPVLVVIDGVPQPQLGIAHAGLCHLDHSRDHVRPSVDVGFDPTAAGIVQEDSGRI